MLFPRGLLDSPIFPPDTQNTSIKNEGRSHDVIENTGRLRTRSGITHDLSENAGGCQFSFNPTDNKRDVYYAETENGSSLSRAELPHRPWLTAACRPLPNNLRWGNNGCLPIEDTSNARLDRPTLGISVTIFEGLEGFALPAITEER